MAYDPVRRVTVLFGGYPDDVNGETWEWDGDAWTQRIVVGPEPRYLHHMAYDSARHVTVLFGGWTDHTVGDTWEWDGNAWTRRDVAGPPPRWNHSMAFDSARGVSVVYGGVPPPLNDTWEWNGISWIQPTTSGPSARHLHAMAYDATRSVTVIFGGSPLNSQTWEWNGTAWTRRLITGPSARYAQAMCFDSGRGVTVLFGGWNGGTVWNADTWELGVPCIQPSITSDPVAQTVCPGGHAIFTVTAAGTGPFDFQWRHGTPPEPVPGATTDTLTIQDASPSHSGPYDCVVSNACGSATSNPAMLMICAADFNCDDTLNSQDFFDFLSTFIAGDPIADFNADTAVNSQDFFDFLAAFFTGC